MLRRSVVFVTVVVLAAVLVPSALALGFRVRVEGKTQTIFGATQPRVTADNPLQALEAASVAGEFYYNVRPTQFGPYVDHIGRYPASGTAGWVFKVNGATPPVGADQVTLKDGDVVLWYYAQFGIVPGGPPTLALVRERRGCYRVVAHDDAGRARPAAGATLHVDGRRVRARSGRACVRRHRGLVRATLPGAIRSNAVR